MNRTTLNEKHRAVLGRWWVTMRDTGGRPPQRMLDELAEVADAHAAATDVIGFTATVTDGSAAPGATPDGAGTPAPAPAARKPRAASTARSGRQPARRGKVTP